MRTEPSSDPGVPPRPSGGPAGTWRTGFHGVVTQGDLPGLGVVSIRDLALAPISSGAGNLDALTVLPPHPERGDEPTAAEGRRHVGVNETAVPPVEVVAPEPEETTEAYIARRLEDASFVFLPNRSRSYQIAKRTLDIVGSLVLLLVAAPVMAVLAVVIRLDSPGPAVFRQTRVTRGGRHFRFYKFRTMYVDAKERFPELYAYRYADSEFDDAFYKLADDPRNTRVGRWLRRTTLDELPNLFNVLLGDLSLVGPRPELPELVRYYRPEELACFFTKAGLTGLAQVAGRSLLTVRERLTLDLRYVAHQSVLLDLRILAKTALVVVTQRGAF